jgi:hypothetical protein
MKYLYLISLIGCSADVFTTPIEAITLQDSGLDSSDIVTGDSGVDSSRLDSMIQSDNQLSDQSIADSADASCGPISKIPSTCYNANHACQCPDKSACLNNASCCMMTVVNGLSCKTTNVSMFIGSVCSDKPCSTYSYTTICRDDKDCNGLKCYPVNAADMGWTFGVCG